MRLERKFKAVQKTESSGQLYIIKKKIMASVVEIWQKEQTALYETAFYSIQNLNI